MKKFVVLLAVALASALLSTGAEAKRQRVVSYAAHPDCNVVFPCEGVAPSPRGLKVQKAMGGFGSPVQRYTPRTVERKTSPREVSNFGVPSPVRAAVARVATTFLPHPAGCPSRAFCGCGAAVEIYGFAKRNLWLAANWLKFPRAEPARDMVAARSHHVFVLKQQVSGDLWLVADHNSGGHRSRLHVRSIRGYAIVNPHV